MRAPWQERLRRQEHAGWAARVQADIDQIDEPVTRVVTVGDEFEITDPGYDRAQLQVERTDPAVAPNFYAASVRELARYHLRFSLDWYLNEDLARKPGDYVV